MPTTSLGLKDMGQARLGFGCLFPGVCLHVVLRKGATMVRRY
jgi:hypothetical protein